MSLPPRRTFMSRDDAIRTYMPDFDPLADGEVVEGEVVDEVPLRGDYSCEENGHIWLIGANRCHVCQTPRTNA